MHWSDQLKVNQSSYATGSRTTGLELIRVVIFVGFRYMSVDVDP